MQDLLDSLTASLPAARRDDEDLPRSPPPPATPLDFPCCRPQGLQGLGLDTEDDILKLFSNILRTGPTEKHLEVLNVSLVGNVPLDLLLPSDFTPPFSWLQPHDTTSNKSFEESQSVSSTSQTLSNGAPAPGHEAFFPRVKELLYDNEDAFRAIQRRPPVSNHPPARVVHFRRFWDGLLLMADYWDTSLDNYSKSKSEGDGSAMDIDEPRSEAQQPDQKMDTEENEAQQEKTYTGRRTDTGRNMPGKYREDTVYAFVETLVWAFYCRLEHPRTQPRLKLQSMILPLPHMGSVYRTPKDSQQVRRGMLEGPMLGVCCRDQTSFRRPDEAEGEGKQEILDLLRETGLMLMLAQKRMREGKEEEVPGKGKWWANAPRWGGGKGGELGVSEDEVVEEPSSVDAPRKRSKKMNRAELWRNVRPPASMWEKSVTYLQIGKDRKNDYDDVSVMEFELFTHSIHLQC